MWFAIGDPVISSILLVITVIILGRLYVRKCFNYWKDRGIVSSSPSSVLGDIGDSLLGRRNLTSIYDAIYKAFPDQPFVGMYDLLTPSLLIRDPKLAEAILVKDFSHFYDRFVDIKRVSRLDYHLLTLCGQQWKVVRTKLAPIFSAKKLKDMTPMMDYCAAILESHIGGTNSDGELFDAKEMGSRYTLDVIGCCMFGLHFNTIDDPESEYRTIGKIMSPPYIKVPFLQVLRFLAPKLMEFFKISENPPEMLPFFTKILNQSEQLRKNESMKRSDMMQIMLDIREREQLLHSVNPTAVSLFNEDVVLSNIFAFYVAGLEATAAALTYCMYELALNPHIQRRLREEIQTVAKANDQSLTYDTLKEMTYLDMVISETLRKYTSAPVLNRICTSTYTLPGTQITLKPGMRVTLSTYSIHRDEKYYPNPQKFDPERFTPQNMAARPPFTFLPFGGGPRACIAIRFAKLEMKLCLARLLLKYELRQCAETEIPIQMHPRSFLMVPKNGIYLRAKKLPQHYN